MDTRQAVASRIENLCKEKGITINGLSYISGVSNSTIKEIFYERRKKRNWNNQKAMGRTKYFTDRIF